ncbi:uncharacterized protein LOC132700599 isoform X2 [Cylas formicarius]|uniref:uncharacterized protein LOC132700599 isoform X2 n=1 Tax=Cylas formicarius TaxID=197179 RepID=UPI00295894F2|nr:uncharacterized protein LOC132700599 isoform X2 [Cylas formicarius]
MQCSDFEDSGSEYRPSPSASGSTESFVSVNRNRSCDQVKCYEGKVNNSVKSPDILIPIDQQNNQPITKEISQKIPNNYDILHPPDIFDDNQRYVKKSSARERPTICPICFNDVITHFTRHLLRYHGDHKDVMVIKNLTPRSKERLGMINALRKQGYFHLKVEKNILNPIRSSKLPDTQYFLCSYCLGHYSKKLLHKHIKKCKNKPADIINPGKNCLSKSQTFQASVSLKNHDFLRKLRIKSEVFDIMRADEISATAKSDPLTCLFGETLLAKHKRQQIANIVSNRMREMARMLMVIKTLEEGIRSFFDVLKPEMF